MLREMHKATINRVDFARIERRELIRIELRRPYAFIDNSIGVWYFVPRVDHRFLALYWIFVP